VPTDRDRRWLTVLAIIGSVIVFSALSPGEEPRSETEAVQQEVTPDSLTIVTPNNRARLCPKAACADGKQIARIPTGVKLLPSDSVVVKSKAVDVTWYLVEYVGRTGYVSILDTDRPPPKYK